MSDKIPAVFSPLKKAARYKILSGGRGSGKSWAIARIFVEIARHGEFRFLCCREFQGSIADSVIQLISDTIDRHGYTEEFEVQRQYIRHRRTNSLFMFYGLKNNISKIKSLEGVSFVWCEEAEAITADSWDVLIPTIRRENSEIWISFNPKNILDATYQKFVVNPPSDCVNIKANYSDNPHFPEVLRQEMEECKKRDYDLYLHIWEGEPVADSEFAIIKPKWIQAAVDAHKKLGLTASGEKVMGFDVADEGEDASAIVTRHGSIVTNVEEWSQKGDVIFSSDHSYSRAVSLGVNKLIYDNIGMGAGVKAVFNRKQGSIQCIGFNAGGAVLKPDAKYFDRTNKDFFRNIKAQMWWAVRDRFYNTYRAIEHGDKFEEDQLISLDSEALGKELEYLKAELSRPMVVYDDNGKVGVESKKDMKKRGIPSPNKADAFIMSFATVNSGMNIDLDMWG